MLKTVVIDFIQEEMSDSNGGRPDRGRGNGRGRGNRGNGRGKPLFKNPGKYFGFYNGS